MVIEMKGTSINRREHKLRGSGFSSLVYRLLEDPSVVELGDCPGFASEIRLDLCRTITVKRSSNDFFGIIVWMRKLEVLVRSGISAYSLDSELR